MRIHVTFKDRVGITQEILMLLGARNLNLDAVEMSPPNVYIDAPTLSQKVLEELHHALLGVAGVQAVDLVDILPGQRRRLQLEALLAAMSDPVMAVDPDGCVLLANPGLTDLYGSDPTGEPLSNLFAAPDLARTLIDKGFRLPMCEVSFKGRDLLLDATPISGGADVLVGGLLTLYPPSRIGERLASLLRDPAEGLEALLGKSAVLEELKTRLHKVASLDAPLLIQGETGTGKELVAHACHAMSARRDASFLALNCAALPESLAESELFGYAAGAFTGAQRGGKPGLLELADRGTVFLDEVGRCPRTCKPSCCGFSVTAAFGGSAANVKCRSMCGCSARPTATWSAWCAKAPSARICITASTSSTCWCRRCASAAWISCCWPSTFCARPASRSTAHPVNWLWRPIRCCWAIAGRAMCGNCKTSSSARQPPARAT